MAAERSMQVRLDLLVGDYVRNADRAGTATEGIGSSAEGTRSALDQVKQVGSDLGQTVITTAGIGAAAMAGWTASAVTAGVAYNSLQQTAGAALETLLGSAEAATEQMAELGEFARTSPFPRQMWIEAQQTLIGFGVEAERVVPIFEALQDGVVAVGGSAQQIEEVVQILSRVSSVGKVTAEDLNQLGERGIDAASLVGEAWGQSASDIRESITAGTVDATEFIDALVEQMSTNFGGAAEGFRETWLGALDRIAGATRDTGASLAAPFVDPDGGGAAVQWANDIADAIRGFEDSLRPAVDVLDRRAEPAFQRASEAMQNFTETLGDLDLTEILDRLSEGAPIFAAFGAAAAAAGSASALSAVGMGSLAAAINPVAAGILGLAAASPSFRDALMDMLDAVAPLIPMLAELALQIAEGLTLAIDSLMPFVEVAIGLVGGMVELFSSLPEPIQQASVAIGGFALALQRLGPVGAILTGVAAIGTFVSSVTDSSVEASLSVNELADDLRDFHEMGRSFRLQEADFAAITGPLAEDMEFIRLRAEGISREYGNLTATGREWIDVQEDALVLTKEFVNAEGDLREVFSAAGTSLGEDFADEVDVVDKALAQMVSEGVDAEEALDLLADSTALTSDEIDLILPLMDDYAVEAERQAEANEQAAEEQERFTEKVGQSVAALKDLADEMRAQVDPVFAAVRAIQDYEDAQDAYNEAVEEHGAASEEALDAEMNLIDAYLEAAAAAGEMAQATGGDLPPELIQAAEAANISEEGMEMLEEAFNEAKNAGEEFGDDLANVNADLTTSTGRMAAQTGLELAGLEESYAEAILRAKARVDELIDAGYSYEEAIARVSEESNVHTGIIEQGFEEARDKGLEFSDDYPAEISLSGDDEVIDQIDRVNSWIDSVDRTVRISFEHEGFAPPVGGANVPVFATGGEVPGPLGAGDVVPSLLTPGEHVWTPREVQAVGGHDAMEAMRAAALAGASRFAQGGPVVTSAVNPASRGASGMHVENLNVHTVTEAFDTRQVMGALALEGVS